MKTVKIVKIPSATNYKQYDLRKHVYMKPDTYIGADERVEREEWLYDFNSKKMFNKVIDFVPGCERIFLEILSNASDNIGRSRRANIDPGCIEITMNERTISVKNYGLPIPIEIHPEEKIYIPQMIFGSLLSSSNYEIDRHESGTNGIGAKATNIFSIEFIVIIYDHIHHLNYKQVWYDNMTRRSDPIINKYYGDTSSVQIIYTMDFNRFKYEKYPQEAFNLFARHAIDTSFTSKTKVFFNGTEFNFSNIKDYASLYFNNIDTAIIHYQKSNESKYLDIELMALDTPDEGQCISFVNCIMTKDGGVHVNAAIKAVSDGIIRTINENIIKKLTKQNKKELDPKEKRLYTISLNDVKPHISILLSVRVLNPKFTSQTKTVLHSPTPKIEIPESQLKAIYKWKLIDRLYAAIEAKQSASLTKTDGKLKRYIKLLKGIDANNAGKSERHQCVLYITEGRSGAGYANKLISLHPKGRDYIGVLPMRGKSLNVMNADRLQIEKNTEISELKKILGLCEGTDYTDQNNFNKLRYGSVMIMADSDVDGKHIIGLIINFFHCRFPSLLKRGFVTYYRTPILRVFFNNNVLKFYTQYEYEQWKKITPNYTRWHHKYYKGLGTSKDSEIKDDYQTPHIVTCYYDDDAPKNIRLAFDKNLSDERKKWIDQWDPSIQFEDTKIQPISTFINYELILFSIADVQRSIPKLMDGLKESQRKVLFGAHKKWKISRSSSYQEVKVAQFSAFVAEKSNYHHGELVLDDVIVGMAQNFTGSNNIPWFTRDGQFGTRFQGGKDAAETRYSYTRPEMIVPYILREEDQPILKYIIDEGEEVEPESYYPIIPMILVNGAQGIGTGYSTFIPNHKPLDIIKWLKLKLQGSDVPNLIPWYNGFEGTIEIITKNIEDNVEENLEDPLENDTQYEIKKSVYSMIILGKYHLEKDKVVITELPVGRWPHTYHKWLENLIDNKQITGFRDLSVDNKVYFEIYGFKNPNYKSLKLKRVISLSNMVALDENNHPVKFNNTNEILEAFYSKRLAIYEKRKEFIIKNLQNEIRFLKDKIKFIQAVIDKKINIINTKISDIYSEMDALNLSREIYNLSKLSSLSKDEIQNLTEQIKHKEIEFLTVQNTSVKDIWLKELNELEQKL